MTEQSRVLMVEALRLSKIAVKAEIRDQGQRLKDYQMKEIINLAELWFSEHRAAVLGQATIGLLFSNIISSA
jgi:hypothetical protein